VTGASTHDSGFGILEVLVALAIASAAVVALGSLFHLAMRLSDTLSMSRRVHVALQDLQGVLGFLTEDRALEVRQGSPGSFVLTSRTTPGELASVDLRKGPVSAELVISGPQLSARADLATFDEAQFEYLERPSPGASRWIASSQSPGVPLAVRMKLRLGDRIWRPLIWIASAARLSTP
jgi:hypothetical protein